ncbi:MAG: hypothetical protein AAGF78_07080 [Pseudomonadota bacterium]
MRQTPVASGRGNALAWATIGALASFAVLAVIGAAVWNIQVRDDRQFQGVLRPVSTPVGVDLPKNAVLEQIVVSQGKVVRKGETLALLDVPEMEHKRRASVRVLLQARVNYLCVTSKDMEAFQSSLRRLEIETRSKLRAAQAQSRVPEAAEDHFAVGANAAAACEIANAAWAATGSHDAQMLEAVSGRLELLRQQIAVVIERQSLASVTQVERSALATDVLALLLEQNRVKQELAEFEAQVAAAQLARDRQRAEQARALLEDIAGLEHEIDGLAALINARRIISPATGIIVRVRDPGPGHAAVAQERVMELARAGGKNFRLAISVPPDEIARLTNGARVELTLAGAVGAPPLGGTIDLDRPLTGGEHAPDTVMVNLSGAARSWLASANGTVALSGGTTASSVHLRLDDQRFGEMLRRASSDVRPQRWSWNAAASDLWKKPR